MQHIRHKLREADFFLGFARAAAEEHAKHVDTGGEPFGRSGGYQIAMQFQFMISAMLSAWQCVDYYMRKKCEKPAGTPKSIWYRALRERPLLAAFKTLRDSDIHDGTFGLAHTTNVQIHGQQGGTMMRWFNVDRGALEAISRFKKFPEHVDLLTQRDILAIAGDALAELHAVVDEGFRLHYLFP